jgi:hypothetical protein
MKSLKNILLLNASSSGITGLLLLILARPAAALFDVAPVAPFVGTGIFLLLFAAFAAGVAWKQPLNLAAVKIITALDILWVLASLAVLMEAAVSLTGNMIIGAVAAWVGLMALLQYRGGQKQSEAAGFS